MMHFTAELSQLYETATQKKNNYFKLKTDPRATVFQLHLALLEWQTAKNDYDTLLAQIDFANSFQ